MASSDALPTTTTTQPAGPTGLKIAILGAGIAGLSCALALTNSASPSSPLSTVPAPGTPQITIFEASHFSREIGAAIHIAPNANGALKRLGISARSLGANECRWVANYASGGQVLAKIPVGRFAGIWAHRWRMAHRVRLHDRLRAEVERRGKEGGGGLVEIRLGAKVRAVDAVGGVVFCQGSEQGEVFDVVVGADGVHSVAREAVPAAKGVRPFDSGKSAFRFLVPRQALFENERTRQFVEPESQMVLAYGPDRRIIMYPTTDNTLVNFVCIHPSAETDHAATGDWNNTASLELVLQVYRDWSEGFKAALGMADPESIRVWKLLDMDVLESWTHMKLALLGDAAHPFLPHQGQGGGQAIEDAVALAVVLERGLAAEEVLDRLKLYEKIRKERAETVQEYTRLAGKDLAPGEKEAVNMMKFTAYNYGHDEFDYARQKLREWKWAKSPQVAWTPALAFGPMPELGRPGTKRITSRTVMIKIKTSRTALESFFLPKDLIGPTAGSWKIASPGTVTHCTFSQTTTQSHGYPSQTGSKRLGLYVHDVEWTPASGEATSEAPSISDGEKVVRGSYLPVLFESAPDLNKDGSSMPDLPSLHSDIDVERDGTTYHVRMSSEGTTWARFKLEGLTEQESRAVQNGDHSLPAKDASPGGPPTQTKPSDVTTSVLDTPTLVQWRGGTDGDCGVVDLTSKPAGMGKAGFSRRVFKAREASFTLDPGSEETLPTLHRIVERLADIPNYAVVEAVVVEETSAE